MKHTRTRILAIFLALVTCLGILPTTVLAAETNNESNRTAMEHTVYIQDETPEPDPDIKQKPHDHYQCT